jgi:hypothetical protein
MANDSHERICANIVFSRELKILFSENSLERATMKQPLILGENLFRLSQRTKVLNTLRWARWMGKITMRESELFTDYEAFLKKLNGQAQRRVYEIHENIPEMFFRICEELGIPAELLDRENLVESLSNVFLHIVHLSDELRLANHQSPEFLEILQCYKRIADTFCKLQFDKVFFSSAEELQLFFECMDEKLQQSGKDALSEHKFSSITNLLISTDFVMDGLKKPVPQSEDFLRLMISTIMREYLACVGESVDENMGDFCRQWFVDKQAADSLVEALCKIFEEIGEHPLFSMQTMKLNVLCKLIPWKEFTEFLQSIRVRHPDEHEFICLTLRSMSEKIQKDESERMDAHYAQVLSRYPSGGFVAARAQIFEFVCDQLSITSEFGQVQDSPRNPDEDFEEEEEEEEEEW